MRETLLKAIDFATKTGSFSVINACANAKNVCVFGTGRFFEEAFDQWKFKENLGVNVLCDNNAGKWGKTIKGLPCISPDDLSKLDNVIVIPLIGNKTHLIKQLQELNIRYVSPDLYALECIAKTPQGIEWFASNKILNVYDMLADDESKRVYASIICNRIAFGQYLYNDIYSDGEYFSGFFEFSDDEVFVDCGAYNGDTILRFLNIPSPSNIRKFKEIHAFEVNSHNFKELEKIVANIKEKNNVTIYCHHAGVWDKPGSLSFSKEKNGSLQSISVNKNGGIFISETVPVVRIDDVVNDATFIKMDIEGAELNALKGAENTIKSKAPKLAVCIYHQLNDFWEIPIYLKTIMPDYEFFVRHHTTDYAGTVLYARKK